MRARLIFIVVVAFLAAAFAGLNWSEFNRAAPLSFGAFVTDASLGMVMLFLLGLTLLVFLLSSAVHESRFVLHSHRHTKALDAQRALAEKAEASRFTDLRAQLETHLRETRQRESIVSAEFEKTLQQNHRELRAQMEQMHRALATRLGELESRLDGRQALAPEVVDVAPRNPVKL
ncbi:hypothetical protein [Caenimonas aquaedulcis]|uniref:LapA family protein n=1 Tax=Caenimonas aquaedulcis TaxID=2793270 RepID=A0A931MES1_9BURK|nr:hypothetical protein [Caenimonas aquaedulcis]MBG9386927.1 hypothetical protein [Caenimonas aquaedulcis]